MSAVLMAVRAADGIQLERRVDFETVLRSCMTCSLEEGAVLDILFPAFWSAGPMSDFETAQQEARNDPQDSGGDADATGVAGDVTASSGGHEQHASRRATYSKGGRAQAASIQLAQDRRVDEQVRRLARVLGTSRGRHRRSGINGDLIDVRDSLRHNLRYGEEVIALRRSRYLPERSRLVVLCDVSSSMLPYTPMFLSFAYSLTRIVRSIEIAVFNVETSFVTDVFRRRTLVQAMAWLEATSVVLAGGTMTGHCLHSFTGTLEARRALRAGTTAMILSDGWDVGDADLLRSEMRRLRAQVGRTIWLDPHAASTGYQPQVGGLQVALPFVDDYLDFSSVDSLVELVIRLAGSTRPRDRVARGTESNLATRTEGQVA